MSAQAPDSKVHPVVWTLAGILCLCTLTALWVTAARVKANKMAARYGIGRETEPSTAPTPEQIRLRRGQTAPAQHFTLAYVDEGLEVRDAQGRARVRFPDPKPGQRLGWQELRMTLREATKDELQIDLEFVPGAASTGAGVYRELKAGLRVEFPHGRALTVTAWDPATLEGKVKVEARERSEERLLTPSPQTLMGLRFSLRQDQLVLEESE
jgi:hypothetical protein